MLSINKTEEMEKKNDIKSIVEIAKTLVNPVDFEANKITMSMLKTIKRLENQLNSEHATASV
jgi:hypothetical protein